MTEVNTAYRLDQETNEIDDPLAELERIVSGEPSAVSRSQSVSSPASVEQDLDIEAELMRELGEAEPAPIYPEAADTTDYGADIAATTGPDSNLEAELSLEDQLMAELTPIEADVSQEPRTAEAAPVQAGAPLPSAAEDQEPLDRVEQVASKLQWSINPSFDDPRYEYADNQADVAAAPVEAALPTADAVEGDELDEFFTENFADMLESEQAAQLDAASEPVMASNVSDDFDFGEAFNAELAAEMETQPVSDQSLEDDFAKAFESEISLEMEEPVVAATAVSADALADPVVDPQPEPNSLDSFDANDYARTEPAPSRNGFKMAVAALCLALVAGIGVVAWGSLGGGSAIDEPVIIKADTEPAKVKPEEPGGKQIANQDNQVYTKVAGTEAEEPAQDRLISDREAVVAEPKNTERLAPTEEPAKETAALGISPKKVKTFTVKPDGTIVQSAPKQTENEAVAAVTDAAANTNEAQTSETAFAAPQEDTSIVSLDGAKTTGSIGVPQPSPLPAAKEIQTAAVQPAATEAPAPKPVATAPKPQPVVQPVATDENAPTQIANLSQAPKPAVTSSEWKVQVSSQRSREAAESSFKNIQRRFGSVLGGKAASIQKADVEGKGTFYRVKVLASSKSEASDLCSRLKAAGGSCFVTR